MKQLRFGFTNFDEALNNRGEVARLQRRRLAAGHTFCYRSHRGRRIIGIFQFGQSKIDWLVFARRYDALENDLGRCHTPFFACGHNLEEERPPGPTRERSTLS